eukprot:2779023-Rhodomonas_salina.1
MLCQYRHERRPMLCQYRTAVPDRAQLGHRPMLCQYRTAHSSGAGWCFASTGQRIARAQADSGADLLERDVVPRCLAAYAMSVPDMPLTRLAPYAMSVPDMA